MGGIGATQLLILLVVVMLVFGTKRIATLGKDLGTAMKDLRKGLSEADNDEV